MEMESSSLATIIMKSVLVILLIRTGHCDSASDYVKSTDLNEFAGKINQYLFPSEQKSTLETLVWSPLSVYLTLDPLIEAAGGSTYSELNTLLHFSSTPTSKKREVSETKPETNTISNDKDMNDSKNNASSIKTRSLKTATGLFISKAYTLKDGYLKKLQSRLISGNGFMDDSIDVKSLDLSLSPNVLANKVNQWINLTTDGLIDVIVQPENFDKDSKMIIVNGVQFKGKWKSKFRAADTEKKVFYGSRGLTEIKMMFQRSTQDYKSFDTDGFQILKLAYADNDMKLVFILPTDALALTSIMRSLTSARLGQLIEQLEPTELDIYLPKFQVETNVPIKHALMKAGLKSLFSRMDANLTRMLEFDTSNVTNDSTNESISLYLNDIVHKTVFKMDEEGTKAGAATAGFFIPLSGLMNHRINNFTLDKPFIFIIRDSQSSIVFQGAVTDIPGESIIVPLDPRSSTIKQSSKPEELSSRINPKDDNDQTETPWWIHKGKPEYLDDTDSLLGSGKVAAGDKLQTPEKTEVGGPNDTSSKNELLFEAPNPTYRFQQPEPSHPEGIRFPHPWSTNVSDGVYQSHTKNKTRHLTYHGGKIVNLRLNNV